MSKAIQHVVRFKPVKIPNNVFQQDFRNELIEHRKIMFQVGDTVANLDLTPHDIVQLRKDGFFSNAVTVEQLCDFFGINFTVNESSVSILGLKSTRFLGSFQIQHFVGCIFQDLFKKNVVISPSGYSHLGPRGVLGMLGVNIREHPNR